MSKKAKAKAGKVEFKEVIEGDKITVKCDLEIVKISELDNYLKVCDSRKVSKVECKLKTGPFKDQTAHFIILDDDKVSLHTRPTYWDNVWKFWFGKAHK